MGVRRVLAGIVALALVSGAGAAAESRPTTCTFSNEFTLVPGLSLTPSSGEFTSGGQTGEIACDGPVEGEPPAGTGNFGADGRYGPDDCQSQGEGDGVQSFTIPLAHGSLHMTNRITFTDGILAAGGLISGRFEGERFSGTFGSWARPPATTMSAPLRSHGCPSRSLRRCAGAPGVKSAGRDMS